MADTDKLNIDSIIARLLEGKTKLLQCLPVLPSISSIAPVRIFVCLCHNIPFTALKFYTFISSILRYSK